MAGGSVWDRLSERLARRAQGDPNRITVTITSSQIGKTYQIEASRRMVRFVLGSLIGMVVLLVVGGISYGFRVRDVALLKEARRQNELLRERVEEVAQLEQEIQQLDQIRQQLYLLAGVPQTETSDATVAMVGTGEAESSWRRAPRAELTDAGRRSPLRILPVHGPVSRGYTMGEGRGVEHPGVDIAGAEGLPIAAAADGRVVFAGWDTTFGNLLAVDHGGGWETKYGHAQRLLVMQGDSVRAGGIIALLGNTGRSSAPHLHFEVLREGVNVDPADYFAAYRSASSDARGAGGDGD